VLPEATYVFKHALVQDAAYESLLKSRRQVIHHRIAEVMRDQFPVLAETEPETIAHHFSVAGKTEHAASWWTKAGNVAVSRGGSVEAIGHFERAIDLADTLLPTPERTRTRLELQVAYRESLILVRGWGDEKTTDAFRRSKEIAEQIDDPQQRLASAFGDWLATYIPGGGTKCLPIAESYLRQAKELGGSAEIVTGERILGESLWCTGDFVGAIAATERSLSIYDYDKHSFLIKEIGSDAKAMLLSFRASSLWPVGRLKEARDAADEAITHGRKIKDAPSLGFALGIVCLLEAARTDLNRLEQIATELLTLSEKNDLIFWKVQAQMWLAAARCRTSSAADCIAEFKQHLDTLSGMMKLFHPVAMGVLVDLELLNEPANAMPILDEYLATTEQSELSWFDAELHRRRGLCLRQIAPNDVDSALSAFQAARKIARAQGARTYDLLACLDLARLHVGCGQNDYARTLLDEALVGFEENPELPAIAEAKQLLSQLRAS